MMKKNTSLRPHRDWSVIRDRVEAARLASEQLWSGDSDQTRRILQARAEELAKEPEIAAIGDTLLVVEFQLAHESYGIASAYVTDIQPLTNLTPLPGTPEFLLGIVNFRGEVLPIVDLRRFFDLPIRGLTDLNKVIVLECERMRFGILADAIGGMRHVALSDIQPALATLTGIRERYLRGVGPDRLVILDARKLILDDRLVVDEEKS